MGTLAAWAALRRVVEGIKEKHLLPTVLGTQVHEPELWMERNGSC